MYLKGKKEGEWLTFNSNNVLISRSNYKNDLLQGWTYGYDIKGKLLGKLFYNKGIVLKGDELDEYFKYCEKNGIDPNN